jgi:hypothetical protein
MFFPWNVRVGRPASSCDQNVLGSYLFFVAIFVSKLDSMGVNEFGFFVEICYILIFHSVSVVIVDVFDVIGNFGLSLLPCMLTLVVNFPANSLQVFSHLAPEPSSMEHLFGNATNVHTSSTLSPRSSVG